MYSPRPGPAHFRLKGYTGAALFLASISAITAIAAGPTASSAFAMFGFSKAQSIWTVETTVNPKPNQVNDTAFEGVSASGPDEAWAVGTYADKEALDAPLAEHWDGSAWSQASVPQPTGQQAKFNAVDDLAPDDAWAVGTSFSGGAGATPAGLTLIEQWNGTTWTILPSPNGATGTPGDTNLLDAIAGTGPDDLWAAGWVLNNKLNILTLLFEHWNGTSWSLVPPPADGSGAEVATSLTAISSNDIWAVGSYAGGGTLAAHWNGKKWALVPTPDLIVADDSENELTGVSAVGADNVWASGYEDDDSKNFAQPYVLHWNGAAWTMTQVPNIGTEGSRLRSIQVVSADDIWAVGQEQKNNGSILSLTEQFNGSKWSVEPSPDPGMIRKLVDNSLAAIGTGGGGNLFAVGADEMNGQCCLRTFAIGTNQG
ncbi:MAG: hypothetical protein WAM97_18155 [Acidimicrobiales bacterium]